MKFLTIWAKHAWLNFAQLLRHLKYAAEDILHILIPPQYDHSPESCESIYHDKWLDLFHAGYLDKNSNEGTSS